MDGPVRRALGVAGTTPSGRGESSAPPDGASLVRRLSGVRARSGALVVVVVLAAAGLVPPAASAQGPVETAPIVIEGVQLRQVLGTAAPLYVTRGVSDEKARWMGDAIDVA